MRSIIENFDLLIRAKFCAWGSYIPWHYITDLLYIYTYKYIRLKKGIFICLVPFSQNIKYFHYLKFYRIHPYLPSFSALQDDQRIDRIGLPKF